MSDDTISRKWLMECVNEGWIKFDTEKDENRFIHLVRDIAPSAQLEREIYSKMSDKEFEKWLKDHGICNPNIRASIPCDAVPLLIDAAINELPSAQPEKIRCKDCKHFAREGMYCSCDIIDRFDHFYCYYAERKEDD